VAKARAQGTSRRHHFLPESYLKHWVDPSTCLPNQTPAVWKITKDGLRVNRYPPASHIFWKLDGNNLEREDGSIDDRIERLLARIEDIVADTTRGPIARMEPLDRDAADALNMFFASMVFRVPSARLALASSFGSLARLERETLAAHDMPVPPDIEVLPRNGPIYATLDAVSVPEIWDVLERMTHTLLVAHDGEHFVTSDRPAVIHADRGSAGLANQLCEATLPLSPKVLLLLWWGGQERSGYCPTDAATVLQMNQRTVAHCDQWFINPNRTFDPRWLPRVSAHP